MKGRLAVIGILAAAGAGLWWLYSKVDPWADGPKYVPKHQANEYVTLLPNSNNMPFGFFKVVAITTMTSPIPGYFDGQMLPAYEIIACDTTDGIPFPDTPSEYYLAVAADTGGTWTGPTH